MYVAVFEHYFLERGDRLQVEMGDESSLSMKQLQIERKFKLVDHNVYPLSHLQRPTEEDPNQCMCQPPDECCGDVTCLNYATYVECNPETCPAGDKCENQRLQKAEFPILEAVKTQHKGFGVRTKEQIKEGRMISEYVGEVIDEKELDQRLKESNKNECNFYYLQLGPDHYVDARNIASLSRFFNHSCDPNCTTEKWSVNGEIRIGILTLRDVSIDEELTFDYQWKTLGSRSTRCFCEAKNCRGTIGTVEEEEGTLESARGIFLEAKPNETREKLVGRKIRLFDATQQTYKHGMVQNYCQDGYEIKIDDGETEVLSLDDRKWHIYVDFLGQSDDAIQKMVFSIPKRMNVSNKPVNSSPQLSDSGRKIPRSNPLIKRSFAKKDDASVQKSRFMLIQHIADVSCEKRIRGGTPGLESVKFVHLPKREIWALLSFPTTAHCHYAKGLFHNELRALGPRCRVSLAFEHHLKQFERLERQHKRQQSSPLEKKDQVIQPTGVREYHYGVELNWIVTREEIEHLRQQKPHLPLHLEKALTTDAYNLIDSAASHLHLTKSDVASAMYALQRYMIVNETTLENIKPLAAASLLIVTKATCRRFKFREMITATFNGQHPNRSQIKADQMDVDMFAMWKRKLLKAEQTMLKGIFYDLNVDCPFTIATHAFPNCPVFLLKDIKRLLVATLSDTVWIICPAKYTVLAAAFVAAAIHGIKAKDFIRPDWLPILDPGFHHTYQWIKDAILRLIELSKASSAKDQVKDLCLDWLKVSENSPRPFMLEIPGPQGVKVADIVNRKPLQTLRAEHLNHIRRLGKRKFIGEIVHRPELSIQGHSCLIVPLPYREPRQHGENKNHGLPAAFLRELYSTQKLQRIAPGSFLNCIGLVLPGEEEVETHSLLDSTYHYLVYEKPKHNFAGLMEAGVEVPGYFVRRCLRDIVQATAILHEQGLVHRQLSMNHVYVFEHRAKLGGLSLVRQTSGGSSAGFKLSEMDTEEHRRGSSLQITAPEVLLGAKAFTTASDIWSIGCLVSMILLRRSLFRGTDVDAQLNCIFRICGTPDDAVSKHWPMFQERQQSQVPWKRYENHLVRVLNEKYNSGLSEDLLEVLTSCLEIDPSKRLSARQILNLPFFRPQYSIAARRASNYDHEPVRFHDRCNFAKEIRHKEMAIARPQVKKRKWDK